MRVLLIILTLLLIVSCRSEIEKRSANFKGAVVISKGVVDGAIYTEKGQRNKTAIVFLFPDGYTLRREGYEWETLLVGDTIGVFNNRNTGLNSNYHNLYTK